MADCGGFGNIDFLVKASGLSDAALRLIIGLFSGNLNFIMKCYVDFASRGTVFYSDHEVKRYKNYRSSLQQLL